MKAVIDTNVFVSGIFWKGKPEIILDAWISSKFILLISKPIFDEYSITFREISDGRRDDLVEKWLYLITQFSHCIKIHQEFKLCRDPSDNKWLNCAVSGNADFLVSGDKDLLILKNISNIPIIKPAEFIKKIVN